MLRSQKRSLQIHRASQVVCVVDRVRLGLFNMSVCIIELAFPGKQARQGEMGPKQLIDQVKRGCNSGGYLEMVNGFLYLVPGAIYIAKNAVTSADQNLLAFLQK